MRYRRYVAVTAAAFVLALCVTPALANVGRTNSIGPSALTPLVVAKPSMVSMAVAPARAAMPPASIGSSPIYVEPALGPFDRVDPWSGAGTTAPVTVAARRETDKVDPWSGETTVVPHVRRLAFDTTDPWAN